MSKKLVERVKKLVGVKWSQSKKAWYVLDTQQYAKKFGMENKYLGKEILLKIHPIRSRCPPFVNRNATIESI